MIHLIKTKKGFEGIFIAENGEVTFFTKQGYQRRQGVFKALVDVASHFSSSIAFAVQDDTREKPVLFNVWAGAKVQKKEDQSGIKPIYVPTRLRKKSSTKK